MKKTILTTSLCFIFCWKVLARPTTATQLKRELDKIEWEASVRIGGDHVNNTQVQARVFGLTGNIEMEYPISDTLDFELDFGANLEVGSNNSFIIAEYAPRRQWSLGHAYFDWEPFEFIEISAGAINQGEYNSPLLLTNTAFLGAQLELSYDFTEEHSLFFKFEHAIPNNINLAQRIGIVESGTPIFTMSTVGLEMTGNLLSLNLQGMKWSFTNLSTDTAFQSQFLGNSVSGGGQLNSDFIYSFSGYNAAGNLELMFSDSFGLTFDGQFLLNDKAPDDRNVGTLAYAGLVLGKWRPYVGTFRVESDSSPAFYNTQITGHNNQEGNIIGLDYGYRPSYSKEQSFSAKIEYVDSTPLEVTAFQSDTKKIIFFVDMPLE